MLKKLGLFTISIMMMAALTACGGKKTSTESTTAASATEEKGATEAATNVEKDNSEFSGVKEDTPDHYEYKEVEGGVCITKYINKDYAGAVIVPEKIDGKNVVEIGTEAFATSDITAIKISNNVITIGKNAFLVCTKLKTVIIGDGVKTIGDNAFSGKTLENVTFGKSVELIGKAAFLGCTSLKDFVLPDSLKEIKDSAFAECPSITKIVIPNNVTTIEIEAFELTTGLKEMTLPAGVTIGVNAVPTNVGTVYKVKSGSQPEKYLNDYKAKYASTANFTVQTY